jgi:hypothetical protein
MNPTHEGSGPQTWPGQQVSVPWLHPNTPFGEGAYSHVPVDGLHAPAPHPAGTEQSTFSPVGLQATPETASLWHVCFTHRLPVAGRQGVPIGSPFGLHVPSAAHVLCVLTTQGSVVGSEKQGFPVKAVRTHFPNALQVP